jgi:hypothetical protein
MRQRLRSHLTFGNVISLLALFIALGGTTYAATGGNFILGNPNSASSTTALTAPVAGKGLQVTNTSTGTGATALGLTTASGHPPFTVNSGTKVTNLNADKLDGLDSSAFVPNSKLVRVGPASVTPSDGFLGDVTIATVGHFTFTGGCDRHDGDLGGDDEVFVLISTNVDHSTYGSMTQAAAGGAFGNGDMSASSGTNLVVDYRFAHGTPNFNPASGTAVAPDGQQVTFDLYQAMNARNQPGQCIFGGTFAVK